MKRIAIAIAMLTFAAAAYAACRTITILKPDGTIVICQECCNSNGNCTITCI